MENIGSGVAAPSLKQTIAVKCEECGGEIFMPAYMLRKVSKLLIGAKNDGIIPIDTFVCAKCGHVNSEFIPEPLKKEAEEPKEEPEEPKKPTILTL